MSHAFATLYHGNLLRLDFRELVHQMMDIGIAIHEHQSDKSWVWDDDNGAMMRVRNTESSIEEYVNCHQPTHFYWLFNELNEQMWCSLTWPRPTILQESYDLRGRTRAERIAICERLVQRFHNAVVRGEYPFLIIDITGSTEDVDWDNLVYQQDVQIRLPLEGRYPLPDILGLDC